MNSVSSANNIKLVNAKVSLRGKQKSKIQLDPERILEAFRIVSAILEILFYSCRIVIGSFRDDVRSIILLSNPQ